MKKTTLWATVCFLAASGCTADPYAEYDLGPSRTVVAGCIDAMGGLGRWQSVGPIKATAVVTTYDETGRAVVNEQQQIIDMREGLIKASAAMPGGRWEAVVEEGGPAVFEARGFAASQEMQSRLIAALRMTLHRVRGPMNLCGYGERPAEAKRVRLAGWELIRVPVTGGSAGAKAYYFDAQTCALRLVTAGADAPGGDGTVTIYSYRILSGGMAFPARISVMKIGQHVLIGDEPVLEVDYREVKW